MESFQQSGLNVSRKSWLIGLRTSGFDDNLQRAIPKDIEPFRISLRRTADAGEYAWEGGVETRE